MKFDRISVDQATGIATLEKPNGEQIRTPPLRRGMPIRAWFGRRLVMITDPQRRIVPYDGPRHLAARFGATLDVVEAEATDTAPRLAALTGRKALGGFVAKVETRAKNSKFALAA